MARPRGIYRTLDKRKLVLKWANALAVGEEIRHGGRWLEIQSLRCEDTGKRSVIMVLGVTRSNGEFFTIDKLPVQDCKVRVPQDYTGIGEEIDHV